MHNLKITYNTKNNIVYINKQGNVTFAEACLALSNISEKYGKNETLYILEDSRNSKLNISLQETRQFIQQLKKSLKGQKEVRHADLFNTPLDTAMGIIFQHLAAPIKAYHYKCFSTEKAALEWLKKGVYYSAE